MSRLLRRRGSSSLVKLVERDPEKAKVVIFQKLQKGQLALLDFVCGTYDRINRLSGFLDFLEKKFMADQKSLKILMSAPAGIMSLWDFVDKSLQRAVENLSNVHRMSIDIQLLSRLVSSLDELTEKCLSLSPASATSEEVIKREELTRVRTAVVTRLRELESGLPAKVVKR